MTEKNLKILEKYRSYLHIKNYKTRGIDEKLRSARVFTEYLENEQLSFNDVNIREAENYRETLSLKYSAKTINYTISALRYLYKYLTETKTSFCNPFTDIDRIKERQSLPKNVLNIEETKKLLNSIEVNSMDDFKFKVITELLYSTGARISEIENLVFDDIDLDNGYIKITDNKERHDRKSPLTEYSQNLLDLYLKVMDCNDNNSKYVFLRGRPRTLNKWMNSRLKRYCSMLKIPIITCHGIRHTLGTQLLKNGADIREVQEYLGHKDIKNTEVYTRINADDLKDVIQKTHPREISE